MGFKNQLDKFEKVKLNKVEKPNKIVFKGTNKNDKVSSYDQGYKDMDKLRKVFSKTFCKQMVFVLGFGRKTSHSDPLVKDYCDGFNDRLEGK